MPPESGATREETTGLRVQNSTLGDQRSKNPVIQFGCAWLFQTCSSGTPTYVLLNMKREKAKGRVALKTKKKQLYEHLHGWELEAENRAGTAAGFSSESWE